MVALQPTNRNLAVGGQFPISSQVLPGLVVILDSIAILSIAIVSYVLIIGGVTENTDLYFAAATFVWLVTLLLMNFAAFINSMPFCGRLPSWTKSYFFCDSRFFSCWHGIFNQDIRVVFTSLDCWLRNDCLHRNVVRLGVAHIVKRLSYLRMFTRNVVVAGAGEQAETLLAYMEKSPSRFITLLGLFSDNSSHSKSCFDGIPILGGLDDVDAYVRANEIDDVIIALPWSTDQKILAMVNKLRELPVNVYLSTDLIGFRLQLRQPPDHFGAMPLVEITGRPLAGWGTFRKAALDYGLGIILIVPLLPVMALIAIAIKLDSKGPVLFRQKRHGFVSRVFEIYKFRTMRQETNGDAGKTVQATRDDPRITRVGRLLRRLSLDELPQLFNVLNGTMSLVGPRPHAIDHNEEFSQTIRGYFARHRVKPGITGWAQVNGLRGETKTVDAIEARVKHDIYYVENWSLLFDLQILAATAIICLTGRNAH
jgi:Undecaprenyl-phosphate glucose phosphotransferase